MALQQWKQRLRRLLHPITRWRQYAAEQLIGLDIGPGSVKLLKIDASDEPYCVENFGMVPLASGVIVKEEIKDAAALGEALKQVCDEAQVKTKSVAFAIPRSSTIIKTITVDKRLNSADIESRAWVEANHHFPDLVGDIYLDFDIIGPSEKDPTQLDLLLVACRKDQIKPYLDVLAAGGFNAKIVDVNCYALERALSLVMKRLPKLKTVALLNLDYSTSSLNVVHEGQLIYAHDHSFEGLHFNAQIQEYSADKKNTKLSMSDAAYVDILKAGISAHLRHSMHFFYASRPHVVIQKLILGGDCATIPYLNSYIQQETGIETILANPFEDMEFATSVDEQKLRLSASAMMLSCGLALSQLKEMVS